MVLKKVIFLSILGFFLVGCGGQANNLADFPDQELGDVFSQLDSLETVESNNNEVIENQVSQFNEISDTNSVQRPVVRRVYFNFDDSKLSVSSEKVVRSHADYLKQNPSLIVTIEGHCDARGTREYNIALGERRGNRVKDALISMGVDRNQLSVVSYGEEKPINLENNKEAWAQNRRVEFRY